MTTINILCDNESVNLSKLYTPLKELIAHFVPLDVSDMWYEDLLHEVCVHVMYSDVLSEVSSGKRKEDFWKGFLFHTQKKFLFALVTKEDYLREHLSLLTKSASDDPLGGTTYLRMTEKCLVRSAKSGELFFFTESEDLSPKLRRTIEFEQKRVLNTSNMDTLLDIYSATVSRNKEIVKCLRGKASIKRPRTKEK